MLNNSDNCVHKIHELSLRVCLFGDQEAYVHVMYVLHDLLHFVGRWPPQDLTKQACQRHIFVLLMALARGIGLPMLVAVG